MSNHILSLKGLRTPRSIVFFHGFVNGRFKTAGIDPESSLLNSAYVSGKAYRFSELCRQRVIKLETELAAVRTEAETLILELNTLPVTPPAKGEGGGDKPELPTKPPKTISEAQSCRAAAKSAARAAEASAHSKENRDRVTVRRGEIIHRLIEIRDRIATRERICCEELGATADALKAQFCTYGHGVLLKPVSTRYIPDVEYAKHLDGYRTDHDELKRRIAAALNEEGNAHV